MQYLPLIFYLFDCELYTKRLTDIPDSSWGPVEKLPRVSLGFVLLRNT